MYKEDLTVAIVGSGGEGVVSAGEILVRATSQDGLYSMMIKSYGPQIRGGESLAQIRLNKAPVLSQGDKLDALIVLSWENFNRFAGEISLSDQAIVAYEGSDKPPENLSIPKTAKLIPVPFTAIAKSTAGTALAKNIVALGFISGWFTLPENGFENSIRARFAKKSEAVQQGNLNAYHAGAALAAENENRRLIDWSNDNDEQKLILSGNDAISLGSAFAGVDFFAGYPITPASEIMEWMALELPKLDRVFVQTEEEIAAITMAIGASFAGAKAMTATSGPGLSLMTEGIGLAAMAELPLVIVDVQRAGPSTGIPTKTTQSDLFHAVFGGHGNLPRVVLAPMDAADAIEIAVHAFYLSEKYQTPVLVLSDQFLGQRLEVIPNVDFEALKSRVNRRTLAADGELQPYRRFKMTENGISPLTIPGLKNGMYTAAGIEHDETGKPTSSAEMDEKMTRKRQKKLQVLLKEEDDLLWRCGDESASLGIIAWGSTKGVVEEAILQLNAQGYHLSGLICRQLAPLPVAQIQAFLNQIEALLVVELADRQFYTYLKSQLTLPEATRVYKRAGAAPFTTHEIISAIKEVETRWNPMLQKTIEAI